MSFKTLLVLGVITLSSTITNVSFAKAQCDAGGVQSALRSSANQLHAGNPVRYIDFANDARFGEALSRMKAVGVPESKVKSAWAKSLKQLCGAKAERISTADLGSTQTLSGLSKLLGI